MTDDRDAVMDIAEEENAAIAAGDAERYFVLLADDCTMMPPNTTPKSGHALRVWLADFIDAVRVESLGFESGETVVAGDWAWHEYACDWRVTPRAGGPAATPRFKGLHVLRRDAKGAWKIVRNIWNLNPPAAK